MINLISNVKPNTTRVLSNTPVKNPQYKETLTHDTVSFSGLHKVLSKRLFESHAELKAFIDENYPDSNGIAGNLPAEWVMSFPKDKRGEKTKEIINAFGDAAEKIKTFGQIYPPCDDSIKEASDIITDTLLKNGLIKQHTEPKKNKSLLKSVFNFFKAEPTLDEQIQNMPAGQLMDIGSGSLGRAFAFRDENNTYVLKAFHHLNHKTYNEEVVDSVHYQLIEPNRAAFIKRNAKERDDFPEFYFADLNRGFMIIKYIDDDYKVNNKLDKKAIGVDYFDYRPENFKNDVTIDFGDLRTTSPFLNKSKTARWVYTELAKKTHIKDRSSKWNELFEIANDNTIPNCNDILVGLYDFVRFLPRATRKECYEKFNHLDNFKGDFKTYLASFSIKPLPDETPKTLRQKAIDAANLTKM